MSRKTGKGTRVLELVDVAPVDESDDEESLAPFRSDDPEQFESFYRREYPRLLPLTRALVGPALAADVAQEAMIAAYRRWPEVRNFDSPVGWVRGVCSRKAASLVRRKSLEARTLARLKLKREPRERDAVADDDAFWRTVRELPARQAQVVALHYALDLPLSEVASTLDCAEGTVKAHLFRARAALAQRLEGLVER